MKFWIFFNLFVLVMLALDLGLLHRKPHVVRFKEALVGSAIWIALALSFAGIVYLWRGHQPALEFTTGYLIELSLSVDNLFVFLLLFSFFKVPKEDHHTVLFWGIVGALVMRGVFILAGVTLINRFHWLIYLFGAFLIYSGIQLAVSKDKEIEPEKNPVLKLARRLVPMTSEYQGSSFFVRQGGRSMATPLFAVLIAVETTDLLFAVDSIPAVLAISRDPFIVYTSNVFAILGLRSMYFALEGMLQAFHYLSYGLSAILVFVGVKMLLSSKFNIPVAAALGVVGSILLLSVVCSVLIPKKANEA